MVLIEHRQRSFSEYSVKKTHCFLFGIKAPDAPQKPHGAPVKAKPTSLAKAAKKGPKVSQNAAKAGSKNPVSAREIRKTAKILGSPISGRGMGLSSHSGFRR
jgi:hypothetical protein